MPAWSIRLVSRVLLGLFAACLAVLVVDPVAKAAWAAPSGCATPAPAALAGFFDDAVPARMVHDRVPGAVVSVVAGGNTVFAKGYGQADTQRGVAFDASRSLVRIASITKLFTWTAVMQQVDSAGLGLMRKNELWLPYSAGCAWRWETPAASDCTHLGALRCDPAQCRRPTTCLGGC